MVRSTIITEDIKQTILRKLRGYIREKAGALEYSNGASEEQMDAATLERLLAFRYVPRYEDWKAALERLEEGTYGICMLCHEPIPREELETDPLARFCSRCEHGFGRFAHKKDSPRMTLVN